MMYTANGDTTEENCLILEQAHEHSQKLAATYEMRSAPQ